MNKIFYKAIIGQLSSENWNIPIAYKEYDTLKALKLNSPYTIKKNTSCKVFSLLICSLILFLTIYVFHMFFREKELVSNIFFALFGVIIGGYIKDIVLYIAHHLLILKNIFFYLILRLQNKHMLAHRFIFINCFGAKSIISLRKQWQREKEAIKQYI